MDGKDIDLSFDPSYDYFHFSQCTSNQLYDSHTSISIDVIHVDIFCALKLFVLPNVFSLYHYLLVFKCTNTKLG